METPVCHPCRTADGRHLPNGKRIHAIINEYAQVLDSVPKFGVP